MSRRRAIDPTKAISITLPMSLLNDIDDKLTRTSSRSLWIATACKTRLKQDYDGDDLTVHMLLWQLRKRGVIGKDLYTSLIDQQEV